MENNQSLKYAGQLKQYSGYDLLKAMKNIDRIPVPDDKHDDKTNAQLTDNLNLIKAINGARDEMSLLGPTGLTVSLNRLKLGKIPEPIWERLTGTLGGEIYVVGNVLDGSGKNHEFKTRLFRNIKDFEELPLGSGGMLVSYLMNPKWFIDIHLVVMESDSEYRKVGQAMEKAKEDSKLDDYLKLAQSMMALDPTRITTVLSGFHLFYDLLTVYLKNNGDDYLGTIHDFYLEDQAFGEGTYKNRKFGDLEAGYSIKMSKLN